MSDGEVFLEIPQVPVHVGVLWESAEEAKGCARGDVRLAYQARDGFISNVAFDEAKVDYSLRYDNALHFSPYFQAFEDDLAKRLLERYDLRGKDVVEIGAGGGRFLGRLCELGDNRGTGYDPSHDPDHADESLASDRIEVVRDYYSEKYADRPADLICCRHVLEHIPDPRAFLAGLRRALEGRPETTLYFEVPNTYLILEKLSIWDIIYEHCGYFVPETLDAMFRQAGFEILDQRECYEGQFASVEARVGEPSEAPSLDAIAASVAGFGDRFGKIREHWQRRLGELSRAGKTAVVWGGGAKAVSFLNLLEIGDQIEVVVDINPGKQGSFLAGSGQPIVAPEALEKLAPDVAIVMNPVYEKEIAAQLAEISPKTEVESVS